MPIKTLFQLMSWAVWCHQKLLKIRLWPVIWLNSYNLSTSLVG